MRKLLLASTTLLAVGLSPATADSIVTFGGVNWTVNANTSTLTLVNQAPAGNQVDNIPCVICGTNQPQQFQDFGFNNYTQSGNTNSFAAFSDATQTHGGVTLADNTQGTAYDASFLRLFLASLGDFAGVLNVGIDVNSGNTIERLDSFAVLDVTNKVVLAFYNPPTPGTPLPTNNQGTGFPDYFLTGFNINRNDIQSDTKIEFFARWNNASDGAESFFLVPQNFAVPGPVVASGIPGLIAALGVLCLAWRRRLCNS